MTQKKITTNRNPAATVKIKLLKPIIHAGEHKQAGDEVETQPTTARWLINRGAAKEIKLPPKKPTAKTDN